MSKHGYLGDHQKVRAFTGMQADYLMLKPDDPRWDKVLPLSLVERRRCGEPLGADDTPRGVSLAAQDTHILGATACDFAAQREFNEPVTTTVLPTEPYPGNGGLYL